jgi:predicted ATP-dependent endonuclease of OLD family
MKNNYLRELTLPDPSDYKIGGNETNCISNLSRVNLFIGQNNSGKSKFIRKMFADFNSIDQIGIKYNLRVFEKQKISEIIKQHLSNLVIRKEKSGGNSIFEKQKECLNNIIDLIENKNEFLNYKQDISEIYDMLANTFHSIKVEVNKLPKDPLLKILKKIENQSESEEVMVEVRKDINDFLFNSMQVKSKTTFIPSLRTIRNLGQNDRNILRGVSAKQHFENTNFMESIFTGENIFAEISNLLSGGPKERDELENFQEYISTTFFNNQKVGIYAPKNPTQEKEEVYVQIGQEKAFPISQLGDGIQQIILLTYPLFLDSDKEHLVFLDEPELHLHPGFQRIFLETIKNGFPNCQFFIATHSNHFLDLTIEQDSNTSIFTFKKELIGENAKFSIQNVSSPDHSVLDLIGVKNSSVFLTNCTIWVEGITDRLYIQRFLEIYQKEFKKDKIYREDIDFSLVEYGGANITHWSFIDEKDGVKNINIDWLCGKAFLITDNDGATETNKAFKKKRFEKLKAKLGEHYECLNCREIENLLSLNVLKSTITIYEKNILNIEFNEFSEDDYRDKPLGDFIDKEVFKSGKKRKIYSNGKSGTLNDKLLFCKRALDSIKSIDNLHPEAIALCKKIYTFIESKNK